MKLKRAQESWRRLRHLMVEEQEGSSPTLRKSNRRLSSPALAKWATQGKSSNVKRQHPGGGRRDELQRRHLEIIPRHVGMLLGEPTLSLPGVFKGRQEQQATSIMSNIHPYKSS